LNFYHKKNYDLVRLGMAKRNMEKVEPTVRDADSVYFNLSALKQMEAAGLWQNSPNGFSSEEACQLCHYAGMSDKLSSIGFYGYYPKKDRDDQTAQLIAHMIWYFLDGIYHRKRDFPATNEGMLEYIVTFKDYDLDATFWKSPKSGRWWLQMDSEVKGKHELIPCSYEDYKRACHDELTERVLTILGRYI
ncbi:MAG: arginase, partial [Bacteroidota bacterium]